MNGNRRRIITRHYIQYSLLFSAILTGALAVSTLLWWQAERRLDALSDVITQSAEQSGWRIHVVQRSRGGWPLGASLILTLPEAAHLSNDTPQTTVAWAGQTLVLGGYWGRWLHGGLPFRVSGHQIARFQTDGQSVTLAASDLQGAFQNRQRVTLTAPALHVTLTRGARPLATVELTRPVATILLNPEAGVNATRLGLRLTAQRAQGILQDIAPKGQVYGVEIALALAGTSDPGRSYLDARNYSRLLLQYARTTLAPDPTSAGITLSANLTMPDLNGAASFRLDRWHQAAAQLLDLPAIQARLAPETRAAIRQSLNTRQSDGASVWPDPLDVSLSVRNGWPVLPTLPNTKFLPQITRMFDGLRPPG